MPIRKTFDQSKHDDFSYDSHEDTEKVIEAAQHYNFMLAEKHKQQLKKAAKSIQKTNKTTDK